jgi:quercetin dioxygenase-like cupin family protein
MQLSIVKADDPDPSVMEFRLPKDLQWPSGATSGSQSINLFGDPKKPGYYGVLIKWLPHSMSRPHTHPNDRYIYVVSGTWWVGWGPKYDPDSTYPIPAGSYVHHFANQLHYDGAKDQECIIYIVGMGPA